MTDAHDRLNTAAKHLVEQLNRLERRHRAGITPDFGDLQDLFDAKDLVERNLGDDAIVAPPRVPCAMQPCPHDGVTPIIEGSALVCLPHADQLKRALQLPRVESALR